MNRYDHQFFAICPTDNASIEYSLTIKTDRVIMVEDIMAACQARPTIYHEDLADTLFAKLGGRQKLRAMHQGIHITTTREKSA